MASEITELFITKLSSLCPKEINYPTSKNQLSQLIKELKEFQKILKGAEDDESNHQTIETWNTLLQDIYCLEDIVEPLICMTSFKAPEIFILKLRKAPENVFFNWVLINKIGQLKSKIKKLLPSHPNDAQAQPGTSLSNAPDVNIQPTYSEAELGTGIAPIPDDNAPATVSSELGAGIAPIPEDNAPATISSELGAEIARIPEDDAPATVSSELGAEIARIPEDNTPATVSSELGAGVARIPEDNAPATVIDLEGSPNSPRFRRIDSIGVRLGQRKSLSRNWSYSQFFDAATIPDASYEILEDILEDLVNKLAQPVLSSSKLQFLMLKADVSCSGKALLLWTVYNAETVKQHFNFRAWVDVSDMSEELQIVNAILEHCNYAREGDGEALPLRWQILHDFLVWKRFLIVLYGVQEGFHWDSLKPIFPKSCNGSRVILAFPRSDCTKSFGKGPDERPQQHLVESSVYLAKDNSIITAKDVIKELTEAILSPRRRSFLISIVGVVGSGKTTLLWPMYNAEDVQSHFQCCAWVHVPEEFNERDLLTVIWEQVTGLKTEILLPLKSLRQRLCSFLDHKRYLVVLYDVWTAEIWENIKLSLPNSLNGSRVVLAVPEGGVALKTNSWVFTIASKTESKLLHNLKNMEENASRKKLAKRWEKLADIMDEASAIVGLEDKLRELAELVLNSNKMHSLVSVLGVAGSGKTTLVKTFYNSIASKQHFECRAWISVPQDYEERDILLDLYRQLRKDKENRSLSAEQVRKGLSLFLTWKRYLIVLDDVRTPDIWNQLNHVIPNSANGSRVILTIRKSYLAYHMNPRAVVLSLRPLNPEESWELFTKKIQTNVDDIPLELKQAILQRCHGIPLTIAVLGGLLSIKDKAQNYSEWSNVIEQTHKRREKKKGVTVKPLDATHDKNEEVRVNIPVSSADQDSSIEDQSSSLVQQAPSDDKKMLMERMTTGEDQMSSEIQSALFATEQKEQSNVVTHNATLGEDQSTSSDELTSPDEISLSNTVAVTYQNLSPSSKCCLLYLGLFPRSHKIPITKLLQLWLAEGLVIKPTGEKKPLEVLANDCFEELLRSSMIEIAGVRLDGSPKECRVTNTLYDTLLLNAEKAGFFHIHRSSGTSQSPQSKIRRLAEHLDMYINTNPLESSIQHLRSYISFYRRKGDEPTSGVSKLLNNILKGGFGMLVVLDLEGVYKPTLSEKIGMLRQLKYLGLRRTLLDSLPDAVGDLTHLETLDIKHTYIVTLPSMIWEAEKLRHLYMSEIYFCGKKSTHRSLENLQTLWGLIIRRKLGEKDWLVNLTDLRKLKLTCLEASMELIAGWLSGLSNLQSLKLRSISDSNEPAQLKLGNMGKLENLSQLYLLGLLPESFKVSELPKNLVVLTLSVSHLSEDPMKALGGLEKLKVLRLYARSFKGKNMICHPEGFPQLQVLKLWMLQELQSWTVEDQAMPVLKEVEIRCCKKLERVDGLEKLTTLKELTLTNMEPSFMEHAQAKVGSKVEIINNVWKFPPPWDTPAKAES